MTSGVRGVVCGLALLLISGVASGVNAQVASSTRYLKGQSIQPAYEGWEQNPDGTYSLWFGYLNRNWAEEPNIPVGPDNNIQPGGPDRGQPTFFQTGDAKRRQYFAFKVVVPADWPKDRDVVWTLTANGTTLKAVGSLWPVWLVNGDVISANRGAYRDTDPDSVNNPPTITEAPKDATVPLGTPLTLTMAVTDDDMPKRRSSGQLPGAVGGVARREPAGPGGASPRQPSLRDSLRVSWVQWRGPGRAKFDPEVVRVADDAGTQTGTAGKAGTTVTFDKPGTYMLRAYAEDMSLFTLSDTITVTVTGASTAQLR